MDFDLKSTPLRSPRDVFEYLVKNGVQVPHEIMKWCPLKTDATVAPPHGDVLIHSQILALGIKLPLTAFVHSVLSYIRGRSVTVDSGRVAYSLGLQGPLQPLPPEGMQA